MGKKTKWVSVTEAVAAINGARTPKALRIAADKGLIVRKDNKLDLGSVMQYHQNHTSRSRWLTIEEAVAKTGRPKTSILSAIKAGKIETKVPSRSSSTMNRGVELLDMPSLLYWHRNAARHKKKKAKTRSRSTRPNSKLLVQSDHPLGASLTVLQQFINIRTSHSDLDLDVLWERSKEFI